MATTYTAEDVLRLGKVVKNELSVPDDVSKASQPKVKKPQTAEEVLSRGVVVEHDIYDTNPKYLEQSFAKKMLEKRGGNLQTAFNEAFKPTAGSSLEDLTKRPDLMDLAQIGLGQAAGAFMDITGELVMEGLSLVIPDSIEEAAKKKLVEGVNYVMQDPNAKGAVQAIGEGAEAYRKWATDNPVGALKLEGAVNLATFFAPPVARREIGPSLLPEDPNVKKLTDVASIKMSQLSSALREKATKQEDVLKKEAAYSYVMPIQIKEERLKDLQPGGMFKTAKLDPSPLEKEAIDYVSGLGINPNKSKIFNWKVISKAAEKEAEVLRNYLKLKGRDMVIPTQTIQFRLGKVFDEVALEPLAQTADASRILNKLRQDLITLAGNSGTKPVDILTLRQSIDTHLKNSFKFFEKEQPVWLDNAGRKTREALNGLLNDVVGGDFVAQSLRKQHLAYTATKGLAPKAVKELDSGWSKMYKNATSVLGDKVRTARLAGYVTLGATGFASVLGVLPGIVGVSAATGLLYGGTRAVLGPTAKKGLADMLDATNEAMKATKNPEMLKELRLGRSLLLEAAQLPEEEDEKKKDKE